MPSLHGSSCSAESESTNQEKSGITTHVPRTVSAALNALDWTVANRTSRQFLSKATPHMTNSDCKAKRAEAEVSQAVKQKSLEDERERKPKKKTIVER